MIYPSNNSYNIAFNSINIEKRDIFLLTASKKASSVSLVLNKSNYQVTSLFSPFHSHEVPLP